MVLKIGARDSALSRAQVKEVLAELQGFYPEVCFEAVFVQTRGDKDLETSLRFIEKTDFFTQELDEMLLRKEVGATIHSAKDLPDPLPCGLKIAALTCGVDPADVLVCRLGESLDMLPACARIGTSSLRREQQIATWRPHWTCVDIRGTIESRLDQLNRKSYDAVVMAKAALIRLDYMCYPHWELPGAAAPLQGRLAVLVRSDDEEMLQFFSVLERS